MWPGDPSYKVRPAGRVVPVRRFIALNLGNRGDFSDFMVPNKSIVRKILVE